MQIDTNTQLCAVIGNPVAHSLSPAMHNAAFEACGLNFVYVAFAVYDVAACLQGMRALAGFRGMSVTIPHKEAVMPHLDSIEPLAQRAGCVNTITREDGALIGANTDGLGTLEAFKRAGVALQGKRVLFLGAGGAVRAVAFAMRDAGVAGLTVLGRNPERLARLLEDLRRDSPCPVEGGQVDKDAARAAETHEVLIQGTPMGMHGHGVGQSPLPAEALNSGHVVFDMVYRPRRTRLIADSEAKGCQVIPGLEMLVAQAALQFEGWTGAPAPVNVMRDALLRQLPE